MPRELRSRDASNLQVSSTSGTQRLDNGGRAKKRFAPADRLRDREAVSSDNDSDRESPARPVRKQQASAKVKRIQVSENCQRWAEKGFYDLPAIPNFNSRHHEDEDNQVATTLIKLVLLLHHGKQVVTTNVLSKKLSHYSTAKNINFDVTFADAKRLLRDDFGYALVKIDPGKPVFANDSISSSAESAEGTQQTDLSGGEEEEQNGRAKTRKGSAVHYILVNTAAPQGSYLNCGKKDHLYDRDADPMAAAKLTMLTLTLLYIFMEGGDVMADLLFHFLKSYGFDSDIHHPLVGKVKDLLQNTFTKQQYLIQHSKSATNQMEQSYYKWGARADLEFSRVGIIEL